MVGAFISVSVSPVSGFSQPSRRMLTTDWLMDRLPAEAIAMMRWPGRIKTWSLRKVAMLSTPALVRVSANMTRPSRTRMPQQYVMTFETLRPAGAALYTDAGPQPAILGSSSDARSEYAWTETHGRRLRTDHTPSSGIRPLSSRLHQILLADCLAQAVVVVDELADEFVHSLLKNFLHAAVLESRPYCARLALGRSLAAIGARDVIQVDHEVLVATRQRTRHLIAQNQEVGDQPRLHALAIHPMVGGQCRHGTQDGRPLEIIERSADALMRRQQHMIFHVR